MVSVHAHDVALDVAVAEALLVVAAFTIAVEELADRRVPPVDDVHARGGVDERRAPDQDVALDDAAAGDPLAQAQVAEVGRRRGRRRIDEEGICRSPRVADTPWHAFQDLREQAGRARPRRAPPDRRAARPSRRRTRAELALVSSALVRRAAAVRAVRLEHAGARRPSSSAGILPSASVPRPASGVAGRPWCGPGNGARGARAGPPPRWRGGSGTAQTSSAKSTS